MHYTVDEYQLGMAIRIDPIYQEVEPVEGIATYRHRSVFGDHTFRGLCLKSPTKSGLLRQV